MYIYNKPRFLLGEEEPQRARRVGPVDDLDLVRADLVVELADRVLDRLLVDEAHDVHVLELAEAVDAAGGLDLVGRVEARLEEVEPRRRRERDAARAGAAAGPPAAGWGSRATRASARCRDDLSPLLGTMQDYDAHRHRRSQAAPALHR